jgi:hypothetical protein
MNKCTDTQIQEMLPDLLHGSLDERAREEVEMHLATCESCREDLDVIRAVKGAAVFAPVIDVAHVVRQIPPYRMVVPGVEHPTHTRIVTWLVAAGLLVAIVGGGSALYSRRTTQTPTVAVIDSGLPKIAKSSSSGQSHNAPVPKSTPIEALAPAHARGLALASDIENLSDGNLVRLMNDMDRFDALPAAEPEPVISVDSGDSL